MSERRHQLPDELVQELLNEIEDTGRVYARQKADASRLEHKRKGMKAAMMNVAQTHGIGAHQRQEVYALQHPSYQATVEAACKAIEDEVNAQIAYDNAVREYEAWRTLSANARHAK